MVYRPPKKNPTGSRFSGSSVDPLAGPLSRAPDGEEIIKGDDRNLVMVDENYAGGDFEDRMWLFWRRQKNNLLIVLGLACLGVIGWQGWKLYQQHLADQLQAEYQAAEGGPALLAFAQAHPDTTQGKLAQLEAADAFYKDGKFADAAKAYTDAITIWGAETYGQRARIGLALSLLQNNDAAGALQQLGSLAKDTQSVAFYRSEAAFNLAVLSAQAGDQKDMAQWVDEVKSLKDPTWGNETTTFVNVLSSAPGAKTSEKVGGASPENPITLTNSESVGPTVVTPTAPAAAVQPPASAPPAAVSMPSAPPAAAPAPSSPAPGNGFDLSGLQKATGSAATSN